MESPFLPASFGERGLSSGDIGVVIAAGTAVRLAARPALGLVADRFQASRLVLGAAATAAGGISHHVPALMQIPTGAVAFYVFAHGAGAGLAHPFMTTVADGLAARGIATLRYQFPFKEHGSKRPDRPPLAQATVRAAVAVAAEVAPRLPLFAGGKSFGGRMTSQAQAESPLCSVRGLAFLGFPLHPANKPSTDRADHLARVAVPMLFLQGTRDASADFALLGRPR